MRIIETLRIVWNIFLQAKVLSLSLLITAIFFSFFGYVATTHFGQLNEFMNTKDWAYLIGTGTSYVWILTQTCRLLKMYLPHVQPQEQEQEDLLRSISSFGSSLVILPFVLFIFLGMVTKGIQDQLGVEARLCALEGKKDDRCVKVMKYYENVLQKD